MLCLIWARGTNDPTHSMVSQRKRERKRRPDDKSKYMCDCVCDVSEERNKHERIYVWKIYIAGVTPNDMGRARKRWREGCPNQSARLGKSRAKLLLYSIRSFHPSIHLAIHPSIGRLSSTIPSIRPWLPVTTTDADTPSRHWVATDLVVVIVVVVTVYFSYVDDDGDGDDDDQNGDDLRACLVDALFRVFSLDAIINIAVWCCTPNECGLPLHYINNKNRPNLHRRMK